jgi:Ca-activated chloride channel homolog
MLRRLLLTVTSVLLTTSPAGAQGVFTSRVDMIPLTVTVTDQAGRYVSGLTERDFAVFEDGVQQSVSFFARERTPVDVALVLDTSGSMTSDMPLVREAANGLVGALEPGDRSAVVSVSATVVMPQRFTADREQVTAAIDGLHSWGSTAVYDGVYIALREFERERRARSEVRRQVLVLLSDGQDNASHVSADDMAELAKRVGVNIYVIALCNPSGLPRDNLRYLEEQRATYAMRALAQNAGGLIFLPGAATELPAIYRAIAQEIGSQYDLAYTPAKGGR